VEHIQLEGATWSGANDFYTAYLAAVGAPEWHGRNLDAVWDSLIGDDINQRKLPFSMRITGTALMSKGAQEIVGRFEALIHEAKRAGHPVEIEVLP
jgi:RNAse (barnase) inhibitor barstar